MSVHNLDKVFKPQRIAVIGASDERPKVGWTVLRNLIGAGFEGVVYPVNAKREAVQGMDGPWLHAAIGDASSFYRLEGRLLVYRYASAANGRSETRFSRCG